MTRADASSPIGEQEPTADGDAKAKFRQALARKRTHQADRAAEGEAQSGSKIHGEHGAAGGSRMFRRKSGG